MVRDFCQEILLLAATDEGMGIGVAMIGAAGVRSLK